MVHFIACRRLHIGLSHLKVLNKLSFYQIQDFIAFTRADSEKMLNPNHVMFTMGTDFGYQEAGMQFKNMDKLIKHMNERTDETGIHVLYSTPACYVKVLRDLEKSYGQPNDVKCLFFS